MFGVWGLGFMVIVYGLWFSDWGVGLRLKGQDSGFRVLGLRFRV